MSKKDEVDMSDVLGDHPGSGAESPGDDSREDAIEDDRQAFEEGDRRGAKAGLKAFVWVMVCLTLLIFGGLAYLALAKDDDETAGDEEPTAVETTSASAPQQSNNNALAPLERNTLSYDQWLAKQRQANEQASQKDDTPAKPASDPAPAQREAMQWGDINPYQGSRANKDELTPAEKTMQRRLSGALPASSGGQVAAAAQGGMAYASAESGGSGPGAPNAELNGRLNPSYTQPTRASMLADQSFLLGKGQMIPCGTITEIDTTVPGMVSCRVSRNVYSMDGQVVLIDQGSKAIGTISGGISQGQARVFVLWQDIRTPYGVTIPLNSPGTNALGSTGIPGQVDSHFWQRFGSAIMFSVLSDAGTALVKSANEGTSVELDSTTSESQALAREALQNSIDIPPTLYVSHGTNVSIFVARDVDFSGIYGLESAHDSY